MESGNGVIGGRKILDGAKTNSYINSEQRSYFAGNLGWMMSGSRKQRCCFGC